MYAEWLRAGLEKPGKDVIGLAKALKLHPSAIYKMIDAPPKRHIRSDELPVIAKYIEEPLPDSVFVSAPVAGIVEAGSFKDANLVDGPIETIEVPRDSLYSRAKHVVYKAAGDSMTEAGIHDGDQVICVDFQSAGGALRDGMKVVVEQNRGGLIERSIKVAAIFPDRTEFQPRTLNNKHKPIVYYKTKSKNADAEVRVLAIARRVIRDL